MLLQLGRQLQADESHVPKQAASLRQNLVGNKTVLPPSWCVMETEEGIKYYWNVKTKVSQWDPPIVSVAIAAPDKSPPQDHVNV